MQVRARISSVWTRRMWLLSAFLIGSGCWFFYDGLVWWPEVNRRVAAYEALKAAGKETEWEATAKEHGWPAKPPGKGYRHDQIIGQYIFGGAGLAAGLAVLAWYLVCRKRELGFDGSIITGEVGTTVPLESIVDMDRRKWDSKGIAVALYEVGGQRRKLLLDDYKYEGGIEIIREIRKHLIATGRWPDDSAEKSGEAALQSPSESALESPSEPGQAGKAAEPQQE